MGISFQWCAWDEDVHAEFALASLLVTEPQFVVCIHFVSTDNYISHIGPCA